MSARGKTVKMADKLYNLRSLVEEPPAGWDRGRVQGYFTWAWHVVAGLRGTNVGLEAALDKVFACEAVDTEGTYAVLPARGNDELLSQQLEAYLAEMARVSAIEDD